MKTLFYLIETQHTVYKSRSGLLLLTGKSGKAISNMCGETKSPTLATSSETHQARGKELGIIK